MVGGGDSALEEATFLTRFADKVYLVHRRDSLRASAAMQDRAFADPKIEFLWNRQVAHIYGDEKVTGIGLVSTNNGTETRLDVTGLFVAIGSDPRTTWCADNSTSPPRTQSRSTAARPAPTFPACSRPET